MSSSKAGAVVCFGELLLRLSAPGAELLLQRPRLDANIGGAEANVAVSLARLGHTARLVGAVPANPLGEAALGEMRRHGVDVSGVLVRPGRMGLYFLAPGAVTRPSTVVYDRAGSVFALTGADAYDWPRVLADARLLHISGITAAVSPQAQAAGLAAVAAAGDLGVPLSFDCNFRPRLWEARGGDAAAIVRQFVEAAAVLFGNERDMALLLGAPVAAGDPVARFTAAATAAFAAFPRLTHMAGTDRQAPSVATQTLAGLLAVRGPDGGARVFSSRPHTLTGIIDRIGSGDAFAAGILHALAKGWAPDAVVDFAAAAAALKHAIPGDANRVDEAEILACAAGAGLDVKR